MLMPLFLGVLFLEKTMSFESAFLKFNERVELHLENEYNGSVLFYFLKQVQDIHPLSVTVTPCCGTVQWSLNRIQNEGAVDDVEHRIIAKKNFENKESGYKGSDMHTISIKDALSGLYTLLIQSVGDEANVHIYASMEPGGPYDLTMQQDAKLKLVPLRRRKLSARWEPSLINPQYTEYCMVVSSRRSYSKLCEAEIVLKAALKDFKLSKRLHRSSRPSLPRIGYAEISSNDTDLKENLTINCTNQTHLTLNRMMKNKTYYFNLFTTNTQTLFSTPYAKTALIYNSNVKPVLLRDGKPKSVNLKKHEGRVSFRFRVAETGKIVHIYVLVCGGAVNAQVMHKRDVIPPRRRVNGYARFNVLHPKKGEYYSLKITAADADELTRIRSVEAFATQFPKTNPLPELPPEPEVYEYVSMKSCTSVTIGWIPAYDESPARYCVLAKEIHEPDLLGVRPDQCALDARLRRSNYAYNVCSDYSLNANVSRLTVHDVRNLSSGRSYIIQVTVKRLKGRTLSYKLLTVYTKHICD